MSDQSEQRPPKAGCPICGKAGSREYLPFCSARCADVDLSRWLKGGYVIPAAPDETEAPPPKPDTDPE